MQHNCGETDGQSPNETTFRRGSVAKSAYSTAERTVETARTASTYGSAMGDLEGEYGYVSSSDDDEHDGEIGGDAETCGNETMSAISESDQSSDFSDSDFSGSDYSSSDFDSSDDMTESYWSSDEDSDEYDDLMADLPISYGNSKSRNEAGFAPVLSVPIAPLLIPMGLPISSGASSQGPGAGGAGVDGGMGMENPLEGLAMLKNLKADLEQVGRMIVAKKDGEKFLQRAHILASINWLASNVPSCVLDYLGREVRGTIHDSMLITAAGGNNKYNSTAASKKHSARKESSMLSSSVHISGDDLSDASDLSCALPSDDEMMSDYESSDYESSEDDDEDGFSTEIDFAASMRPPTLKVMGGRHVRSSRPEPKRTPSLKDLLSGNGQSSNQQLMNGGFAKRCMARRGSIMTQELSAEATLRTLSSISSSVSVGSSIDTMSADDTKQDVLPAVSHFQCALLFVDISGFTKLATTLDPESLSKVINSYFQKIVDKVYNYGGDIQKFAGDAVFADFRTSPNRSLAQCVEAAAACSASLVKDCADFPVVVRSFAQHGEPLTHLNIHCGIGVGEMAGIHVGDSKLRREYVYIGNPIHQASEACNLASLGQVVVSRKVYNVLSWASVIDEPFALHGNEYFTIADRGLTRLKDEKMLDPCTLGVRNARSRGITEHVDGLETDTLIEYRRLMSLYVHPVVVSNDVAAADDFKSSRAGTASQESHREEAELRSVYCMFISPIVNIDVSGVNYMETAQALHEIFRILSRELLRYSGQLRQFIVDDKGLVAIATFGLRGSMFPNLVAERALPASVIIHNALQMELGIDCRIGATFGDVYCGPVGGIKRHEYAVMGPSINLAARLMASPENPGILVDNAVRNLASRSYSFLALDPVNAKGYKDPVPIFQPLTALERTWGTIEPLFVGRRDEISTVTEIAKSMCRQHSSAAPRVLLLSGQSGMGKSTALVHAIEHVRKLLGHSNRLLVAKNIAKEVDAHIPFTTIRPLLISALQHGLGGLDSESVSSSVNDLSISYHTITSGATGSSSLLSASKAGDCLETIGKQLNVEASVIDNCRRTVLEDAGRTGSGRLPRKWKSNSNALGAMVSFIAQVFRLCCQDAKLTLIALDDAHHTDAASWLVLREIFESADNVLIFGTTSVSNVDCTFRMEQDFWTDLNDIYSKSGRFVKMELSPLSRDDLEHMTEKALGVQRQDISHAVLNEVVVQSGGMPRFASQILEGILARSDTKKNGRTDQVTESISDIILHRIDTFDLSMRNTLNAGAVLGGTFTFAEVLAVLKEGSDAKEEDLRRQTADSLKQSVTEGVLLATARDGLKLDGNSFTDVDDTAFTFYQDVWLTMLLSLMLDSRKCDLHRKIALSIERGTEDEDVSLESRLKLFKHWRATGDTSKTVPVALMTGKALEENPDSLRQSFPIYEETLHMWGWDLHEADRVAGFSSHLLSVLEPRDLGDIIRVLVAYGRSLQSTEEYKQSVSIFENALHMFQVAKSTAKLRDRSVVFPAFVGLAEAVAQGHIHQDAQCRYEQAMIRRFLEETRIHGRLIHHIYALYLQMTHYSRQDELEKAIAVQSIIKKLYKPEVHSELLMKSYGIDVGALSCALGAYYEMIRGDIKQSLRSCRQVLKELLSKIHLNYKLAFSMMYPLSLVLKAAGFSGEARAFFNKVVMEPFGPQSRQCDEFALPKLHEALLILFDLSGKQKLGKAQICEISEWVAKRENLLFEDKVNVTLGRLGRCANTVSAEICLLLSAELDDDYERSVVLEHGKQLAYHATVFHRKHGTGIARKQAQNITTKIRLVGG